ncbi:MAG TPA: gamma-glutamylcyclotransferase [Pirellulales bacterium]|jgi:cation transport protein ChaC
MWVFGYGSLMWDGWHSQCECLRTLKATLQGFRRIFNKASVRNWGTKRVPGPTLNITADPEGTCVGFAFEFPEEKRQVVMAVLRDREGRNFQLEEQEIIIECGTHAQAIIPRYVGPNLIRDKSPAQLARMARSAIGTSGRCAEYVSTIAAKLVELDISDPAVQEFSAAVRSRLVIFDKNFLQSEDRTTPRLCALARCGCEFVLIDTLIYELCSDSRLANLWPSIQRKLFPFADRLHLWFHSSELLRREVANNAPVNGPEDWEATQRLRAWFRSGQAYVPGNLKELVEDSRQQREIDTLEKVTPMARAFGDMIADAGRSVGLSKLSKDDLAARVRDNLDGKHLIWAIRACYGNTDSPENHIPDAANRIDSEWFAFHNARVKLALIGIFLQKYGLTEEAGRKFSNTKLDLEYLALLHYADALASDETSGDMAEMCRWLFGSTKKQISTARLLASMPTKDEIRLDAYFRWDREGGTHGHDLDDWLSVERQLLERVWDRL